MNEQLQIDDFTFEVRRSKVRKTIGITVDRDASLIAHLPMGISLADAEPVIKRKLVWVHQKTANPIKQRTQEAVFRKPEFVDGEAFYVFGRHYRLKLVEPELSSGPVDTIRLIGEHLLLRRDQVTSGAKRMEEFYTRVGRPFLNEAVFRWQKIVGVTPGRFVNVADLGFRWGSCSSDGTLNFHWRTMQLPPQIIGGHGAEFSRRPFLTDLRHLSHLTQV
jgi:predicted metal-dependent hydrolase